MCGRYALWTSTKDLQQLFELDLLVDEWQPSWNAAPSQALPVIFERLETSASASGGAPQTKLVRRMQKLEWGLVPNWAKQPRPMINARVETVGEKPSFAQSLGLRRCLVPANGYYEWQQLDGRKQPYFLTQAPGDPVMAFAGLYDAWRIPQEAVATTGAAEPAALGNGTSGNGANANSGGSGTGARGPWLRTFTILTEAAPDSLGHIHERTPVVVPEYLWGRWLDPEVTDIRSVLRFLEAMERTPLRPRPVSRAVGSVRNNRPQLVDEIDLAQA